MFWAFIYLKICKLINLLYEWVHIRHYALTKRFEIYEKMVSDQVQMNEATLKSVTRLTMAVRNGYMAFNVV